MTSKQRILARVARGAKLLDEKKPGWAKMFEKNARKRGFSFVSGASCVLGNVFGGYGFGMDALNIPDGGSDFAFNLNSADLERSRAAILISQLESAWEVQIARRLGRPRRKGAEK